MATPVCSILCDQARQHLGVLCGDSTKLIRVPTYDYVYGGSGDVCTLGPSGP